MEATSPILAFFPFMNGTEAVALPLNGNATTPEPDLMAHILAASAKLKSEQKAMTDELKSGQDRTSAQLISLSAHGGLGQQTQLHGQ